MKTCACGGDCVCHIKKDRLFPIYVPLVFPIVFPLIFPCAFLILFGFSSHTQPVVKHIEVDGKDCIVQHVNDSCTSTGACRGHDIAVCK